MTGSATIDFAVERQWLESLLRTTIPMAAHMELTIGRLDEDGIRLDFPLPPSVNDKGTAFGGALASAMILAGWSLPRLLLRRGGIPAELVIGRCELRYVRPVSGPYVAECAWPDQPVQQDFLTDTDALGKGRLDLSVRVLADNEVAASLQARYAALITR